MQEKPLNIYQKVLGVMADVEYIQKGDKKVNGQYRFVSHDQVTGTLHPALVRHGVCVIPHCAEVSQDGNRVQVRLTVRFVNADDPQDFIETDSYGQGIDSGDKGIGKAYSYAYKYALLKTFCLETGDDPDNDAGAAYEAPKKEFVPTDPPRDYQILYFQKELHRLGTTEEAFFEEYGLPDGWESIKQNQMAEMLDWARERYQQSQDQA